jgi:alpha/beta superfamily hydrolase
VGEVEDARAALSFLLSRYPHLPFTLAGFSFGSRVALKLGCQRIGATRVIAVGFPTRMRDTSFLSGCTEPASSCRVRTMSSARFRNGKR